MEWERGREQTEIKRAGFQSQIEGTFQPLCSHGAENVTGKNCVLEDTSGCAPSSKSNLNCVFLPPLPYLHSLYSSLLPHCFRVIFHKYPSHNITTVLQRFTWGMHERDDGSEGKSTTALGKHQCLVSRTSAPTQPLTIICHSSSTGI